MKANAVRMSAAVLMMKSVLSSTADSLFTVVSCCINAAGWTGWWIDSVQCALIERYYWSVWEMCCVNSHWMIQQIQEELQSNTIDYRWQVLSSHVCKHNISNVKFRNLSLWWWSDVNNWIMLFVIHNNTNNMVSRIACGFLQFMSVVSADVCSIVCLCGLWFVWNSCISSAIDPLIVVPAAQNT